MTCSPNGDTPSWDAADPPGDRRAAWPCHIEPQLLRSPPLNGRDRRRDLPAHTCRRPTWSTPCASGGACWTLSSSHDVGDGLSRSRHALHAGGLAKRVLAATRMPKSASAVDGNARSLTLDDGDASGRTPRADGASGRFELTQALGGAMDPHRNFWSPSACWSDIPGLYYSHPTAWSETGLWRAGQSARLRPNRRSTGAIRGRRQRRTPGRAS